MSLSRLNRCRLPRVGLPQKDPDVTAGPINALPAFRCPLCTVSKGTARALRLCNIAPMPTVTVVEVWEAVTAGGASAARTAAWCRSHAGQTSSRAGDGNLPVISTGCVCGRRWGPLAYPALTSRAPALDSEKQAAALQKTRKCVRKRLLMHTALE